MNITLPSIARHALRAWAVAALLGIPVAQAFTCSVSVTSIVTAYSPTVAGDNVTTGSYSITCTRAGGDAATLNWSLGADNGTHAAGAQNRVQLGATANRYNYEAYRVSTYVNANRWQDAAATRFSGTLSFGAVGSSASTTAVFYLRLPGSQAVRPAGTYTDTVGVTLRNSGTLATLATGSFGVTVITTANCQFSTFPSNISFNYTSFQAGLVSASTPFGVQCTTGLPYTLAFDAASSVLLGLTYTLSLSASSGTGNGTPQAFTATGQIAGGQAGSCATATCSGSETRTLIISY